MKCRTALQVFHFTQLLMWMPLAGKNKKHLFFSSFNHIQLVVNHLHFQLEFANGLLH